MCLRREIGADELFVFEVKEIRADELFVFEVGERSELMSCLCLRRERDQS